MLPVGYPKPASTAAMPATRTFQPSFRQLPVGGPPAGGHGRYQPRVRPRHQALHVRPVEVNQPHHRVAQRAFLRQGADLALVAPALPVLRRRAGKGTKGCAGYGGVSWVSRLSRDNGLWTSVAVSSSLQTNYVYHHHATSLVLGQTLESVNGVFARAALAQRAKPKALS